MNLKFTLVFSGLILMFINGCSTYSPEDYGSTDDSQKSVSCTNMEPAQAMKCKEREKSLLIGLGADKNCNHPYEYERNRCIAEQAKYKKALDESLKKHTDK